MSYNNVDSLELKQRENARQAPCYGRAAFRKKSPRFDAPMDLMFAAGFREQSLEASPEPTRAEPRRRHRARSWKKALEAPQSPTTNARLCPVVNMGRRKPSTTRRLSNETFTDPEDHSDNETQERATTKTRGRAYLKPTARRGRRRTSRSPGRRQRRMAEECSPSPIRGGRRSTSPSNCRSRAQRRAQEIQIISRVNRATDLYGSPAPSDRSRSPVRRHWNRSPARREPRHSISSNSRSPSPCDRRPRRTYHRRREAQLDLSALTSSLNYESDSEYSSSNDTRRSSLDSRTSRSSLDY